MAMWYRVGSNRLRPATQLFYTRLSVIPATSPSPAAVNSSNAPPVYPAPNHALMQLRSFAAPVQAKSKTKPSASTFTGPRLNRAITAPVVRLVTDDGHTIVSLREALDRAMQLDMDLVEVQSTGKPPVCKIMDFHKEKYKKEIMEKERAKSKSAFSLKSGGSKEVRFKAKTELNDLKVKADGIARLMERGYRVKCTALPSGAQEEDLGEHLSRLLALIKDVCIVESGPHVDLKHAYAIVRHIKFATKKSGKKQVADNPIASPTPKPVDASDEDEEWECVSEFDDVTPSDSETEEITKRPLADFDRPNKFGHRSALGSVKEEPPKAETNRYAVRIEPSVKEEQPKTETNRYAVRTEPQRNSRPNQPIPPKNYVDYNSRERSFNQGRFTPGNSTEFNNRDSFDQRRVAPSNPRYFNNRDGFNQEHDVLNNSMSNNSRDASNQGRDQFHNREKQFQPTNPRYLNNSDGFNQKRDAQNISMGNNSRDAFNQGPGQFHNREMQFQPSNQTFRPPNSMQFNKEGQPPVTNNPNYYPNSPQKGFGAFSGLKGNATDNPNPPSPKFGIFNSSRKSTESSENTSSHDSKSPMPKFGTFSANRTNVPNNQR